MGWQYNAVDGAGSEKVILTKDDENLLINFCISEIKIYLCNPQFTRGKGVVC